MKLYLASIALICMCLTSCKYKGDGAYIEEGAWPLKNYRLVLPSFPLHSGSQTKFHIGNFKTNNSIHINFSMKSKNKIHFDELNPIIEFKIFAESSDNSTTFKNAKLFIHYQRMKKASKTLRSKEEEWSCRFNWDDKSLANKGNPFSVEKPAPQDEINCWTIANSPYSEEQLFPKRNYYLIVNCIQCEDKNNLVGQIRLSSGWK